MSQSIDNLSPQQKRELLAKFIQESAKKKSIKFPLSYGQKALWFLYELAPESAAYNIVYAARLGKNIKINVLRKALEYVVQRHPALRTTYTKKDGEPIQTVQSDLPLEFTIIDSSNWTKSEIQAWIDKKADQPFELEKSVFRVDLLNPLDTQNSDCQDFSILLLTIHHIAVEFWSFEILLNELQIIYDAIEQQQTPVFPTISKNYRDFVEQEAKKLASPEGEKLCNYWKNKLSGELPVLDLPADFPRPPVQTYNGTSYAFDLGKELSNQLRELAQSQGVTLYTLVLTAFQILLSRYCNQEEVLIGTPLVNRSQTEFEKVIGYFVNLVVIKTDLSGQPTFKQLLSQVQKTVLEALEHQDYPFPLLVNQLQIERDPSRSPLVQVSFAWEKVREQGNLEPTNIKKRDNLLLFETLKYEQRGSDFDLSLTISDTGHNLECLWGFNTNLFNKETLARMAINWKLLLQGVLSNPEQNISQLPILSENEKYRNLVEWDNTAAKYPKDKCIHQLFEEQAEKTPDAVAVVCEEKQLTYQELNQKANQLGTYLQKKGVKPDDLVGICVERSLEMIIG
ncbi:condensation domain-containing protein, partial [Crocosphaera sp.]|uniref:condensation domain-containing protein n=1 Tax=Crocosphaera sp. TaxID=2729996 RepID=UPI00257AD73D